MDKAARTRLVALAVLLAISVPLIVIAVAGSSGSDDSGGLRVERSKSIPEVVIYLEDPEVNEPATNGGRAQVRVECLDEGGAVVFRGREAWPFSDTDGGRYDPHVHVFIEQNVLDKVARCRLKGTDPKLEGQKV